LAVRPAPITFLGAEPAHDHLVVIVRSIWTDRLTWGEFMRYPDAADSVKAAGWEWEMLSELANSVKSMGWKEAEKAVSDLKANEKQHQRFPDA
jgi:hypothetical protein